jgi:hypothetical protein
MAEEIGSADAGNPAGGEAAAAGTTTTNAPFYDGFKDANLKAWAANKGFESPEVALSSYHSLEKLMGHDRAGRTVVLPGDDATPEERAAFVSKLGRPDKPDGYEMPKEGDEAFMNWAKETFHEIGLPAKQAKALVDKWQEHVGKSVADGQQRTQAQVAADTAKLRQEWGAAFDDKIKAVDSAVAQFGLDTDSLTALRNAWGPYKAMTFFEKIGAGMGDGEYISGNASRSFNGAMTPTQAQGRITELRADKGFVAKYVSGDASARDEMARLHKWAYPES